MRSANVVAEQPGPRGGWARATILLSFGLIADLATQMTFAVTLLRSLPPGLSMRANQVGSAASTRTVRHARFRGRVRGSSHRSLARPILRSATDAMASRPHRKGTRRPQNRRLRDPIALAPRG